jgi:hypothetical protein
MCHLLELTFVLQSIVVITAQFAGVTSHNDDVAAFCKQVSHEAGVLATVDWGRRFPEVYAMVAEHLAFHTVLISCTQAYALDLYCHRSAWTPLSAGE